MCVCERMVLNLLIGAIQVQFWAWLVVVIGLIILHNDFLQ